MNNFKKKCREDKNLTAQEVGRRLGITKQQYIVLKREIVIQK